MSDHQHSHPHPALPTTDAGTLVAAEHGIARSPHWPAARVQHLQREPSCAACVAAGQVSTSLQVHHVIPFHFCVLLGRPDLELDQRNLITLCEHEETNHHLLIGHLDSFKSSNPQVRSDAKAWAGWVAAQIQSDPNWRARSEKRTPEWSTMDDEAKRSLRQLMDETYPLDQASAVHPAPLPGMTVPKPQPRG